MRYDNGEVTHSPEPWVFWQGGAGYPSDRFRIQAKNRDILWMPNGANPKERAEFLANMRHLVTCVNACRHIPTRLLEELGEIVRLKGTSGVDWVATGQEE